MQGVSQTRDLVGYGGTPPAWKLPGRARLAVSMVVNFEEGAEFAVSDGDPQAEKISEVVSVVPPGRWDQGNEQIFAYGMRAGIWRMLAALEKHRVPATFYMCGRGSPGGSSRPATRRPATAGCGVPMPSTPTARANSMISSAASRS